MDQGLTISTEVIGDAMQKQIATLQRETAAVMEDIAALEITDQPSMNHAVGLRDKLDAGIKGLAVILDENVAEAHRLHKKRCDIRDSYLTGPKLALAAIKKKILAAEESEKERQKLALEAARRSALEEGLWTKLGQQGKDEQWLIEYQKNRGFQPSAVGSWSTSFLEDVIRYLMEEETLATAERVAGQGLTSIADVMLGMSQGAQPLPPIPAPERRFEKPKGVGKRVTWFAVVDDKMLILREIIEGRLSAEAADINLTYLNSLARDRKAGYSVPGSHAETKETAL